MKKRTRIAVRAILLVLLAGLYPADAVGEPPTLGVLLDRLSRTASLFRDTALQFACEETIVWRNVGRDPGKVTFEYVFVHEGAAGFRDYRTTKFLGKRRSAPPEVSPEEYEVPLYLRSAYLWIFVFRDSRQAVHRYRILGEEEIDGIPAVMVEFEPIPPFQEKFNDWFGVAWVDPDLGQLLKVVAHRTDDFETKSQFDEHRGGPIFDEVQARYETVTTLFTEEKNGLRFPGKVLLDYSRYIWTPGDEEDEEGNLRKKTLIRVEQRYRKYQFFSVRSAGEIREVILGPPDSDDTP